MKTSAPRLLYVLTFLLASVIGQGSSNLVCLFNSLEDLVCTWTPVKNATEAPCQITASVEYGKPPKTCPLQGTGTRSCHLILEDYSLTVGDDLALNVSCHSGKNWETVENQNMNPFQNIRLDPPSSLQLENTSKPSYNLTWRVPVLSHYLKGKLEYEVQYKVNNSGEDGRILSIIQDQKWVAIENLSPDTVYEAAVRAKVRENHAIYKSVWSHWSTSATWRTEPKAPPRLLLPVLLIGSLVTIFVITITLLAKPSLSKRLKKVLMVQLPNPNEFFPSLNAVHGGDIQKWLSSATSYVHVAAAGPEVSVLEVMQKVGQGPSPLLLKEYCTDVNAPETSGYSLSSCFTNGGYFFFHNLNSFEIEPCKVYFSYDPLALEGSGSENVDSCSYKVLHEMVDDSQLSPTYNIMATQENSSFQQESKALTQKGGDRFRAFASWDTFSTESSREKDDSQNGSESTTLLSKSPEQFPMDGSNLPVKFDSYINGPDASQNMDLPTSSIEDHSSVFLDPIIQNQGQTNVLCRAASPRQLPSSSESYLSLKDLQSHYNHHSV